MEDIISIGLMSNQMYREEPVVIHERNWYHCIQANYSFVSQIVEIYYCTCTGSSDNLSGTGLLVTVGVFDR